MLKKSKSWGGPPNFMDRIWCIHLLLLVQYRQTSGCVGVNTVQKHKVKVFSNIKITLYYMLNNGP